MKGHRSLVKFVLFTVLGIGLLWSGCTGQQLGDYKDLKYPKLREIQIPEIERVTLANGMRLFLLEDHELPLINMSVRFYALIDVTFSLLD